MKGKLTILGIMCTFLLIVVNTSADPTAFQPRDFMGNEPTDLDIDEAFQTSLYTGTFTYTYNIEVPPGTNGLQPNLQLVYSSQRTKDQPTILGTAWDITQNYIQRDINHTMNDTTDDEFKLTFKGSTYDLIYTNNSRYHTETETFLYIENKTGAPNENGTYWIVKSRDGTTYRFGYNTISEVLGSEKNVSWRWYLDQVTDTHNNSIYYEYLEDPYPNDINTIYPANITYNNDQKRIIIFDYENTDRPDLLEFYDNGHKMKYSRRLESIGVYSAEQNISSGDTNTWVIHTFEDGDASDCLDQRCWDEVNDHHWATLIGNYGAIGNFTRSGTNPRPQGNEYWTTNGATESWLYLNTSEMVRISAISVSVYNDTRTNTFNVSVSNSSDGPWIEMVPNDTRSKLTTFDTEEVDAKYILLYITDTSLGGGPTIEEIETWSIGFVGDLVREYEFDYQVLDKSSRSFLKNVTKYGLYENNLPPVIFNYQPVKTNWYSNTTWLSPTYFTATNGTVYYDAGTQVVDVNGDGLVDIIRNLEGSAGSCTQTREAWINNGSGWESNSSWYPPICLAGVHDPTKRYYDYGSRIVDVNGDGLPDIIRNFGNQKAAWINTGSGWESNSSWYPPQCFSDYNASWNLYYDCGSRLADVNNDGLVDIIYSLQNYRETWINNGNGWIPDSIWNSPTNFTSINYGYQVYYDSGTRLADVNGDGLVDIIRNLEGGGGYGCQHPNNREAWINNGSGWVSDPSWYPPTCLAGVNDGYKIYYDYGTLLTDVNGDGLVDIIRNLEGGGGYGCQHPNNREAWINNGSGWVSDPSWYPPTCLSGVNDIYDVYYDYGTRLLDINGDGLVDVIRDMKIGEYTIERNSYINNATKSFLLTDIQTSLGGQLTVSYKESTYLNNTGNDSLSDLGFNVWVVSSLTRDGGMNESPNITTEYDYANGSYNYEKDEFRGFSYTEEIKSDGTVIKHHFHQEDGLAGREYKTEIMDSEDNPYMIKEFNWTTSMINNLYVTKLEDEKTFTYDNDTSNPKITNTSYMHDDYGNIIVKTSYGDFDTSGDERYEYFAYAYNTSAWLINKINRHTIYASDNSTLIRETKYSYDNLAYGSIPRLGDPTRQEDYLNGGSNPVSTFEYDTYGNVINQTDPNNHSTTYEYGTHDTTYTFPDRQINAKDHVTTYTYDLGTGNVLSIIDPNGFVTNYTYDEFGRIIKELRPYDVLMYPTAEYKYEFNGVAPEKVKISRRETKTTGNTYDTYTFYDGFGKPVQTKTEAEYDKQIVTDFYYDSNGRLAAQSIPYFSDYESDFSTPNSSISLNNLTYDPMGRIIETINPDGTYRTTNYTHWNITETNENGKKKTKVTDAYGQITNIYEFNSDKTYFTNYTYDNAGQLTQIEDDQNNLFQFTYDTLGRKTSMTDPDMGTWDYTYDAAGNLISQADNKDITTTLEYDELNRISKRNSPSEEYNYTYDTETNGTLYKKESQNFSVQYAYDQRLRDVAESSSINQTEFITNYTYDSFDRITDITLPGSENIVITYNKQNELGLIRDVIYEAHYNELGNILERVYANNIQSSFIYDPENLRLTNIQTDSAQNLTYTFDNASNVLGIEDSVNLITTSMDYDDLDRLVSAERLDSSENRENYTKFYTYDSLGRLINITENNGTTNTTYEYGSQPIHSPTQVDHNSSLRISNLRLLDINGTIKTYGFTITNNAGFTITDINWTLYTGEDPIQADHLTTLTSGEDILIYASYDYADPDEDYLVVATTTNGIYYDTESISSYSSPISPDRTITHDPNGNIISDGTNYYEYDTFNRLVRVRLYNSSGIVLEEYGYDDQGIRTYKYEPDKNQYTYYVNRYFIRVINDTGTYDTIYYFNKDGIVARKDSSGDKFYYHPDHLGSTTLITNQTGDVVQETNYYPYGSVIYDASSRFLYTGKELDISSGLMYYGARYYDAGLRQWVAPDPLISDLYNPQGLNRYSYVLNNPYKYTDPDGRIPQYVIPFAIGAAAGSLLSIGVQAPTGKIDFGRVGVTATSFGIGSVAGAAIAASPAIKGADLISRYGYQFAAGRFSGGLSNIMLSDIANEFSDVITSSEIFILFSGLSRMSAGENFVGLYTPPGQEMGHTYYLESGKWVWKGEDISIQERIDIDRNVVSGHISNLGIDSNSIDIDALMHSYLSSGTKLSFNKFVFKHWRDYVKEVEDYEDEGES